MKPVSILMEEILDKLVEEDHHHMFSAPVDEAEMPGYYSIVREPMDLQKMRRNLKEGKYKRVAHLRADFRLMVHNCGTFNKDNAFFYNYCMRIWRIGLNLIRNVEEAETEIDQVAADYRRLKAEVEKRCTMISTELDNKQREQEAANNANEFDKRRLQQSREKMEQRVRALETEKRNKLALEEAQRNQEKLLKEERKILENLQEEVKWAKEQKRRKEEEFSQVCKEIANAHGDNSDTERSRRQHEAVEKLKRAFPEKVFGRMVDLCTPSRKKYNLAVTKVLGKHMVSILCDSADTGRECISYLREQHYPPETFLPIADLRVEPIREHLRKSKTLPGVKLIFDVISMPNDDLNIRKALLFVCGNSLVCDTSEQARGIAYGIAMGPLERYRAVALDGTQFQPSGVVSGGSSDLKTKAKKWDENAIRKLKDRRNQLQEELRVLHMTAKRELDVEMKRNQIRQLEECLKHAKAEIRKFTGQVQQQEVDLELAGNESDEIEGRMANRREEIEQRRRQLEQLERQKGAIAASSSSAKTVVGAQQKPRKRKSEMEEDESGKKQKREEAATAVATDGLAWPEKERPAESPPAEVEEEQMEGEEEEGDCARFRVFRRRTKDRGGHKPGEQLKAAATAFADEPFTAAKKEVKKGGRAVAERKDRKKSGEEAVEGKKPLPKKNSRRDQRSFSISSSLYVGLSRCSSSSSTSVVEDIQEEDGEEEAVIQSGLVKKKRVDGKMAQFGEELAKQHGRVQKLEEEKRERRNMLMNRLKEQNVEMAALKGRLKGQDEKMEQFEGKLKQMEEEREAQGQVNGMMARLGEELVELQGRVLERERNEHELVKRLKEQEVKLNEMAALKGCLEELEKKAGAPPAEKEVKREWRADQGY